jgi:hypothetical protein
MKNRIQNHDNWMTPPFLYEKLDRKWKFDFDPCPFNHNLDEWDGLACEWGDRNFLNPPFSQKLKELFIHEAVAQSVILHKITVSLIPASLSTKLFHQIIKPNCITWYPLEKRVPFVGINTKGQYVNYHLLEGFEDHPMYCKAFLPVTTETVLYGGETIPKFIKANGQQDCMIVIF